MHRMPGGRRASRALSSPALLALVCACTGQPEPPPAAVPPDSPPVAGAAVTRDTTTQRDYGVGIMFFHMAHERAPAADTVTVRAAPSPDAPWLARFIVDIPGDGSWRYDVVVPRGDITSNVLEFGYEESGLPIDSVLPDSSWARLVFGYDSSGSALAGWAPLRSAGTGYLFWSSHLPERAQFVLEGRPIRFFDAPGGRVVAFELAGGGGSAGRLDYHLEPDSVRGDWLRVRVVTPSNACGIEVPAVRDTTVWIRYLDERGRPEVWYFTRGC